MAEYSATYVPLRTLILLHNLSITLQKSCHCIHTNKLCICDVPKLLLQVHGQLESEDDSVALAMFPARFSSTHPPYVPTTPQQQVQVATDIVLARELLDPEQR